MYSKLGLVCMKPFATSLIGIIAILSVSLSCLFIPRMGDLYGRKPIFVFAVVMQIPVYCIVAYTSSVKIIYIGVLFLGPTVIGRMSCGFFLLMEQVPLRHQSLVGAALMVCEGSTVLFWTAYFVWISKNAFFLIWFTLGINVFAALGTFYILESPRYLFGMEKYEKARQVLVVYAKRNGVVGYEPR
jgi:MFS family permease